MRITKWQDNNALTQVGFSVGAGDYRIVNVEVAGSQPGYLGAIGQAFNNAKILGNNIHDNGWSGDPSWNTAHAMYLESGSNVEIGWNWIKNQLGGRCIQLRNASGTSTNAEIHSNVFSNCARSAVLMGAGWTTGIKIYNNLFYDVQSDQGVIRATSVSNALSPEIYSNSFYNNGDDSVSLETNLATAPIIRNNILSESAGGSYCSGTPCSVTIGSHNLCFGNGNCPANWLSSINANPLFVSPTSPSRNFHLQNGSPAIDSGFSVSILRDFDGTIRALQGSAFDIGAYEFCGQNCSVDTTPPANPTGLTVN
jgi:hypothetical protein